MTSEALDTGRSLAMTRPASIAARARARLSNRPRSTSTTSARLREVLLLPCFATISPFFGGEADACFERGEVVPDVRRSCLRQHQRRAVQVERMDHHQIIRQAEILNGQSVAVEQTCIGTGCHLREARHPFRI